MYKITTFLCMYTTLIFNSLHSATSFDNASKEKWLELPSTKITFYERDKAYYEFTNYEYKSCQIKLSDIVSLLKSEASYKKDDIVTKNIKDFLAAIADDKIVTVHEFLLKDWTYNPVRTSEQIFHFLRIFGKKNLDDDDVQVMLTLLLPSANPAVEKTMEGKTKIGGNSIGNWAREYYRSLYSEKGLHGKKGALYFTETDKPKNQAMLNALWLKFTSSPNIALKMKLLNTQNAILIENTAEQPKFNDAYWGNGNITGQGANHLGRMLMWLREILRSIDLNKINNPDTLQLIRHAYVNQYEKFKIEDFQIDGLPDLRDAAEELIKAHKPKVSSINKSTPSFTLAKELGLDYHNNPLADVIFIYLAHITDEDMDKMKASIHHTTRYLGIKNPVENSYYSDKEVEAIFNQLNVDDGITKFLKEKDQTRLIMLHKTHPTLFKKNSHEPSHKGSPHNALKKMLTKLSEELHIVGDNLKNKHRRH